MSRKVWGLPVILLLLVTGLLLAGCGGSSDNETTTKISGSAVDAPIVGALVNVYSSNGKLLTSTVTGLGGAYTKSFDGGKPPFLVQFTNNGGQAFLDRNGDGVKDDDDPLWNGPAYYTYVVNKGGSQGASGSLLSTLATDLAAALQGGVIGQTKANAAKARNMAQDLFTYILAKNAMEVSDAFDAFTTPAAIADGADDVAIKDAFAMRVIQRAIVKMAQGATNNSILPADIDEAMNSGAALIHAIDLLAADLADAKLDGVALPGAMDDLGIPDNFRAAFAAASPTSGDYATWGVLTEDDVATTLGQMVAETPVPFRIDGFSQYLAEAAANALNALYIPALPHPPATLLANIFPNRVLQSSLDQFDVIVVLLDGNDTPINNINQTNNLNYSSSGSGQFVGDDEFTFGYAPSEADTAKSGKSISLGVKLRANSKLISDGNVKVLADNAANRAKPAGYFFSFIPCSIDKATFDNTIALSLFFDIYDLAGGRLDNQSITLTLPGNAVFADGKTTKTVKVSSFMADVEVSPFDNLMAGSSLLFDSHLASASDVKYSATIPVVDGANQPWFADIAIDTAELNSSGNTTVNVTIYLTDSCGERYTGSATVALSVTKGTIVPGTLGGTQVDSKTLNVTVNNGEASGTVIYTAPADAVGFDAFNAATNISSDYATVPYLPVE